MEGAGYWGAVGGYGHAQPGSRLVQYAMGALPNKIPNNTIVYTSFMKNGIPCPIYEGGILSWLTESGGIFFHM